MLYLEKIKIKIKKIKITSETISNIKTVSILNKQKFFSNAYNEKIDAPYK